MFEVHHVFKSQNLKKLKEGKVYRSAQLVLPTFYNSDIYSSILHALASKKSLNQKSP